jgi:hypothetical protein
MHAKKRQEEEEERKRQSRQRATEMVVGVSEKSQSINL